jgi:hypothetical protein
MVVYRFLEIVKAHENTRAFLLYLIVLSALYAPVVFTGKSLLPPLYQPHGVVEGWPYGYDGRIPANTFNVDTATPAYYEWPTNKLVGDIFRSGSLPLWNPYQAAGTPLLADYSTRAFFPYQILEDLSPVWTWDFFILGRLLVAGFFSYLFLRSIGLSFSPSFLGGIFYMFSGTFVWFINLEQMTNVAMMVPVLLYCTELMAQEGSGRRIAILGLAIALVILGGQPEVSLYILLLGFSYFIFRVIHLYRGRPIVSCNIKLACALILGLALAAPLILPFLELAAYGHHSHQRGVGIGIQYISDWKRVFAALTPSATIIPTHPDIVPEVLAIFEGSSGDTGYFRIFATKGLWDYLGGYTGVLPVFLALTGLLIVVLRRPAVGGQRSTFIHGRGVYGLRGFILFFSCFGAVVLLKNFGVRPFLWLGYLPLFDQSWGPRWAGPVWVFCFAMAGALGLEALSGLAHERSSAGGNKTSDSQDLSRGVSIGNLGNYLRKSAWGIPLIVFLVIMALYLYMPIPGTIMLAIKRELHFGPDVAPYIIPSIVIGHAVSVLVLTMALFITVYFIKSGRGLYGLPALAILEFWWAIPRGYDHNWLYLKTIPFTIGILVVFLLSKERFRTATVLAFVFSLSFLWLDTKAPRGYPERYNPFTIPPYVEFLKQRAGHDRVVGGYGVLIPNYAGALGIQDVRYINALTVPSFKKYRLEGLQKGLKGEEVEGSSLWFTGRPERIVVAYDKVRGIHYRVVRRGIDKDIKMKLPYYSFLGVRYILMPRWAEINETDSQLPYLPLIYDSEIKIYENPDALPRTFVAYDFKGTKPLEETQFGSEYQVDAIGGRVGEAVINSYGPNKIVIDTTLEFPGILVLTDVYYPGWGAYVDETRQTQGCVSLHAEEF